MKPSSKAQLPRRHFLQQLLILGGTASSGTLALEATRLHGASAQATHSSGETNVPSKGYRITAHIRTYYEKAQKI